MGKDFKFPLSHFFYDTISFESILIRHKISEFELLCALQEIYRATDYLKNIQIWKNFEKFCIAHMILF